ncbi:MAG: class I adenylate-forming enzyme family protein, partial [Myxococcaceae bacterium]
MRLEVFDSAGRAPGDPRALAEEFVSRLGALGFGPGEVLAVALPNGPEFAAAFIACVRLGVTFAAINPSLAPSALHDRVRVADATGVLSAGGTLVRRRPNRQSGGPWPALILFTSGTSGDARAIALGELGLLSVVESHHAALGYPPGTRILGCLPWTHAFGFTLEFLMGVLKGARLRSVPPASFNEILNVERPEVLFGVPRTLSAIPDPLLTSLHGGIVGGAPIRGLLRERLERTRLCVGYGQTECSPGVTLGRPGEWDRDDFLGRPLGCEVMLGSPDDDGGTELLVRGKNTALGQLSGGRVRPVVNAQG